MFTPREHIVVCHGCGAFHSIFSSPLAGQFTSTTAPGRTWIIPYHACPACQAIKTENRADHPIARAFDHGITAATRERMMAEWPLWEPVVERVATTAPSTHPTYRSRYLSSHYPATRNRLQTKKTPQRGIGAKPIMERHYTTPKLGQLVTVRGIECRVIAIRPAGTIDVEATDGSGRCFRVSGLPFVTVR